MFIEAGLLFKTKSLSDRIESLNKDLDELAKKIDKEYLRDKLKNFANGVTDIISKIKDFMENTGPFISSIPLLVPFGGVPSLVFSVNEKVQDINNPKNDSNEQTQGSDNSKNESD